MNSITSGTIEQQRIERITYLASLASERERIDPMLDTLRVITAKLQPGQALPQQEQLALEDLENKLRQYLLRDDPVRVFTAESLERRLQEQAGNVGKEKALNVTPLVVIILSLGVAALPVLVPPYTDVWSRLLVFSVPFFLVGISAGAAWFYLSALANFRAEVRRAFVLMCIGIICIGITLAQYSLIPTFELDRYPLFKYAGFAWFVPISFLFIYVGLRQYANILRTKSRFTILPLLVAFSLLAILIGVVVPHASVDEELFFDISLTGSMVFTVMAIFSAGVTHAILRNVTSSYAKSMRLFYIYLVMITVSSVGGSLAIIFVGQLGGTSWSLVALLFGTAPEILLLYTGYSFKKQINQ